jgi:hypothetical protein
VRGHPVIRWLSRLGSLLRPDREAAAIKRRIAEARRRHSATRHLQASLMQLRHHQLAKTADTGPRRPR